MTRPTSSFALVPPLRRAPSSAPVVLVALGAIGAALLSGPRVLP